ncbi:Kelch repeat-containing protein [Mucilaginibacter calamicampi]|uniref:Kelch repeat-containing protein n=1 Tax=Mucilaginibacter calamicampi TaxID=1302352 RepID=A0ABW2Z0E3_9SPHI
MKKWIFLLPALVIISLSGRAQSRPGELVKTTNTVNSRSECGMAAANGKLYLIGGGGNAAMPVEIYDPTTATWTKGATAPSVMHHFQPVALGDKIYVLEAFVDNNYPNQTTAANVLCYDTKADSWKKLSGLPVERRRAGAGAAVYNGKLYLAGGIQNGHASGTTNMFDVYDPATDKWTVLANAPHIRDHSMAAVLNDKLYAIGGRNTSIHEPEFSAFYSKVVLEVDEYDFKTGKWSTLQAKLPKGSGGGSAIAAGPFLFYIGGERATDTEPNAPRKDIYYIDPRTYKAFTKASDLNFARNGPGGAVITTVNGNKTNYDIYIAGGAGNNGIALEKSNVTTDEVF